MRSCSLASDTDLGRRDLGRDDDGDDNVVDAIVVASGVSISIPSMETSVPVDADDRRVSELAKFIRKVRQSPSEFGSIDSSSS